MSQHKGLVLDLKPSDSASSPQSAGAISGISPQNVLYLTKVSYNESKHEILAEFSNSFEKIVQRHRFFPFILFSSVVEKEKLEGILLSAGFKGFSIEEENNLLTLRALSFSELKKISNSLALFINKKPIVLTPERTFLLSKEWSFFDSFQKVSNILYKINPTNVALNPGSEWTGTDIGFFLTKEIPFASALKVNEDDAMFLVTQAAWSNLLAIPIESVPKDTQSRLELFLENVFFKNGELLSFAVGERVFSNEGFVPLGIGEAISQIDFSGVWAQLFSDTFFNIGPETKNCACCAPVVLDAKNLLPSSLIKIRFIDDNLFFESSSESFAQEFHNNFPFKDLRSSKRKEFFLSAHPIGPFFKGDSVQVPLMDAKRLISEEKAVLISTKSEEENEFTQIKQNSAHSLNWFCKNKESFFSKEVRKANALLFDLRRVLDLGNENIFSQKSFASIYFAESYKALVAIISNLPNQLTNPSSNFFSTELAKSIISVQEATIARFREFSEKSGYRVLHANKNNAFVKGFSSLKLAKDFSTQTRLPQPQIAGFSKRTSFGFG